MLVQLKRDLQRLKNPKKAKIYQRFFKTGKGEYGEGDKFLGLTVPDQRKIAKKYQDLSLSDLQKLLNTKTHEYRSTALLILVLKYEKTKEKEKKKIVNFYLKNTRNINNWDLVDSSAYKILGSYLLNKDKRILSKLARSKNLWERRIAMLASFEFIKNNKFKEALKIAKILVNDEHDLIHKAVGWMLREIGKRDQRVEERFLRRHYQTMPRTMLRYAIERFDRKKRDFYSRRKLCPPQASQAGRAGRLGWRFGVL
jgi:3-methyladenine DNA glycosylase AlkD